MNGKRRFIPARNAADVHIRRNVSRETTVKAPLEERNKNLYISKKLLEYREADLERIKCVHLKSNGEYLSLFEKQKVSAIPIPSSASASNFHNVTLDIREYI